MRDYDVIFFPYKNAGHLGDREILGMREQGWKKKQALRTDEAGRKTSADFPGRECVNGAEFRRGCTGTALRTAFASERCGSRERENRASPWKDCSPGCRYALESCPAWSGTVAEVWAYPGIFAMSQDRVVRRKWDGRDSF